MCLLRVSENRDYCEADDFEPSCGDNSVVVMTTARYGRMRLGSCVREDLGYVGCKSDVLPQVDWRCSAKPLCRIRIPDGELDQTRPCPGELKTYLEASYICVQGIRRVGRKSEPRVFTPVVPITHKYAGKQFF